MVWWRRPRSAERWGRQRLVGRSESRDCLLGRGLDWGGHGRSLRDGRNGGTWCWERKWSGGTSETGASGDIAKHHQTGLLWLDVEGGSTVTKEDASPCEMLLALYVHLADSILPSESCPCLLDHDLCRATSVVSVRCLSSATSTVLCPFSFSAHIHLHFLNPLSQNGVSVSGDSDACASLSASPPSSCVSLPCVRPWDVCALPSLLLHVQGLVVLVEHCWTRWRRAHTL